MKEFNIVLAGVGGQGALLAAEALGIAAVKDELNVRVSEIHGMAQRGGTVVSNVRIGEEVYSSTVLEGKADVLVGFEPLETLRALKYASRNTHVLMSSGKIPPTELAAKQSEYPSIKSIVEKIRLFTPNIIIVDVPELARKAGSILTQNAVLLGALACTGKLPIRTASLREAVRQLVPAKHAEMNINAFELGCKSIKKGKSS